MSASDDQSAEPLTHKQQRERVLAPGIVPLARMLAGIFDFTQRESPELFERLDVAGG